MSLFFKRFVPLLVVLALLAPLLIYYVTRSVPVPVPGPAPALSSSVLSVLGEAPDWESLEDYQETITRVDFERLLTTVFTTGDMWADFIKIRESDVLIRTGGDGDSGTILLRFAEPGFEAPVARHWKTTADLPPMVSGKPLGGLRIAIDPGHIGGKWSKIEGRWMTAGGGKPVCEGDMTLVVGKLLKPRLEALGASVSLVRRSSAPVTSLRPDSLLPLAEETGEPGDSPAALQKLAQRLFYRTAEIRARAKLVNDTLKPDLVLCLHFNADAWGDPKQPTLVNRSHLHLLLNGAYTDGEVRIADQRHAMLKKLLSRTHDEEALVGTTVADRFAEVTGLPPFIYPTDAPNANPVNGHPYLWARNLLANRLYDCPVIFMEPYVMNSTIDHPRLVAGDYQGLRKVNGKLQPSIFREYADALTAGLARHYSQGRKQNR